MRVTRAGPSGGFVDAVRSALAEAEVGLDLTLTAAVSGGTDSMALAGALLALRDSDRLEFVVAHFNHALRGAESNFDQATVQAWCRANSVPCVTGLADKSAWDSVSRLSPEAAARTLRYRFLARAARDAGGGVIVTGHTADDQAETVLLRVVRGSSPAGLAGMSLVSRLPPRLAGDSADRAKRAAEPPVLVVRPLLRLRRSDTAAFCQDSEIQPRHDASNDDLAVPRNRVRHEIIPGLRKINPSVTHALVRLATIAADDEEYLDGAVESAWQAAVKSETSDRVTIDRPAFAKLPRSIRTRILMRAYRELSPDGYLTTANLTELAGLATGRSGASSRLPGAVVFAVRYRELLISLDAAPSDCPYPPPIPETKIEVRSASRVPLGGGYEFAIETGYKGGPGTGDTEASGDYEAVFDEEALGDLITIRNRRPGDRFFPLGAPGERKLQDVLVDARVPREWRDRVPLVASARGIAWVAGHRIADWARVRTSARRATVRLTIRLVRSPE